MCCLSILSKCNQTIELGLIEIDTMDLLKRSDLAPEVELTGTEESVESNDPEILVICWHEVK